jgi:hypothetical protein
MDTNTNTAKSRRGRKSNTFVGFLSFADAKTFVQNLSLTSIKSWNEWCKTDARPENVPAAPGLVYRDSGWLGMPDFLGYEASGRGRPMGSKNQVKVEDAVEYFNEADAKAASVVVDDVVTGDITTDESDAITNLAVAEIPDVVAALEADLVTSEA